MQQPKFHSVSNNTKWLELRALVLSLAEDERPKFRSKCMTNDHISEWDGEWYYHFIEGGFKDIEWFELEFKTVNCAEFFGRLIQIGLIGEVRDKSLRIYGYVHDDRYTRRLTEEDLKAIRT